MMDMNWTSVDYDMDKWQAVVQTVMNLWLPAKAGKFFTG
jgi:hypothetical protein